MTRMSGVCSSAGGHSVLFDSLGLHHFTYQAASFSSPEELQTSDWVAKQRQDILHLVLEVLRVWGWFSGRSAGEEAL